MTLANWRDLAMILLVLEAFIFGLIPGVILFFAVRGMLALIRKLRTLFPQVQSYFHKANTITRQVSDRVAAPVMAAHAASARISRLGTAAASQFKKHEV